MTGIAYALVNSVASLRFGVGLANWKLQLNCACLAVEHDVSGLNVGQLNASQHEPACGDACLGRELEPIFEGDLKLQVSLLEERCKPIVCILYAEVQLGCSWSQSSVNAPEALSSGFV